MGQNLLGLVEHFLSVISFCTFCIFVIYQWAMSGFSKTVIDFNALRVLRPERGIIDSQLSIAAGVRRKRVLRMST